MSNKNYNVFFNTHTVSGIVISFALFVIFFAGAFSLFKEEIAIWENGNSITHTERQDIDFDKIFKSLDEDHQLTGRDLQLNFGEKDDHIYVSLGKNRDSLATEETKKTNYFSVNINTSEAKNYEEHYSLGEFLYRLHFLAQFPYIGIYLAGFVSLFFLFAIVTGVIVHWKKIISNFYSFNPKAALKRVWTDAHTALGVIGLPFQFMFAVTGAYFCLSLLVLIPANFLYNGDQAKLMEDVRPDRKIYEWVTKSDKNIPSFNQFAEKAVKEWDHFHLTRGFVRNYGGTNMKYILIGDLKDSERFIGIGRIIYNPYTGVVESIKNPNKINYIEDFQRVLGRLHFADFGGTPIKIIYFLLSLITCFVIITGVLIYVEARNKKSITLKQRLYTAKVGHIYLAICLSMLPVTALSFLFVKTCIGYFNDNQAAIYWFYFITWLLFILFFRFKRDNYYTNKVSLLLGAIFGFLVPITNGIISENWLWKTFAKNQFDILTIDVLWIIIASISLLFYLKIKPKVKEQSAFTKHPIDYKNRKKLLSEEKNKLSNTNKTEITDKDLLNKNEIPMRTKIIILWIFLAIGWIVHHIYGLFNIYYNETLIIEGATGETPFNHHIYRILFEGLCLLFGLLTIEVSKKWFKWTSFIWAIIAGIYNIYHFIEALIFESDNISEIFMLALVSLASIFLVRNLYLWKK
ncbi:PepSY domain-containing protein [Polaribacter sp. R2A056_3_33]|uniref:PepSY-associated TM helix domain-containing protein n=1 Tax=Polaribacter sp. R2A056_3_33 TaxID=2745563 RepID=UPI001C4E8CC3|nr:PepSY-associated TM helix domain-containing protein [Polaribacter sp. R2A056_3_33]QXP69683.1 PepSY domain-containing protein [Polaribacter sp. R2A056_3_33]